MKSLAILAKQYEKPGWQNKKRPDSGFAKLPARLSENKILPNCQKRQIAHFDGETFLIFLQNFHFFKFLQFSNPKPYGFFIFQILNPKPQNRDFQKI